jgi:hypothetical protein
MPTQMNGSSSAVAHTVCFLVASMLQQHVVILARCNLANTEHLLPSPTPIHPPQDDVPLPQDETPSSTSDKDSTSLPAPADLPPAETQPEAPTTDAEPATDSLPAAEPTPKPQVTDDIQSTPQPAETQSQPLGSQPSAAAADSDSVPSDKPLNQLRNMGGGSTAQPKTPKKWKTQPGSWFPDASGVQCPPG